MTQRSVAKMLARAKPHGQCLLLPTHNKNGYVYIFHNGKATPAHRYVYEQAHGPMPTDRMACHTCASNYPPGDITYRSCVRLEHIYAGTASDNSKDAISDGRHSLNKQFKEVSKKITCPDCGLERTISQSHYYSVMRRINSGRCNSCAAIKRHSESR